MMTLESLAMYLWHEMPLIGWVCIMAAGSACAGVVIFLDGRFIMRANTTHSTMRSVTADGSIVESESCSVGNDYEYGRKVARNGLRIMLSSLVAFVGFMQLW